jgi:hypothetical protein
MASMTVAYANDLTRDLATVLERLESIAGLVTMMETEWANKGDGTVSSLYTEEHRQQFAELVSWTELLLSTLNVRQVATAQGTIEGPDAEAVSATRERLFVTTEPERLQAIAVEDVDE